MYDQKNQQHTGKHPKSKIDRVGFFLFFLRGLTAQRQRSQMHYVQKGLIDDLASAGEIDLFTPIKKDMKNRRN